jgi:hypothetical protein
MAGRLKFTDREYSDDGSVERRVSIYARGEDKEKVLKPMQKTQEIPKFNWELTSLRFNPITIFFSKIYEYQARYEVTVRGACFVATEIRNILISKNPGNELSDQIFFSLTNAQLLNLIRREVRPINRIDYLDYLNSGLKFEVLDNFQLTVLTFKKWFNQLSVYVYNFINRVDFLLEMKLDEKIIPMCSSKPDGLIHTFLQGVRPRDFGMSVHSIFFVKDSNFKSIHDYIEEFMETAKSQLEISTNARSLHNSLNRNPSSHIKSDREIGEKNCLR